MQIETKDDHRRSMIEYFYREFPQSWRAQTHTGDGWTIDRTPQGFIFQYAKQQKDALYSDNFKRMNFGMFRTKPFLRHREELLEIISLVGRMTS